MFQSARSYCAWYDNIDHRLPALSSSFTRTRFWETKIFLEHHNFSINFVYWSNFYLKLVNENLNDKSTKIKQKVKYFKPIFKITHFLFQIKNLKSICLLLQRQEKNWSWRKEKIWQFQNKISSPASKSHHGKSFKTLNS